MKNYDEKLILKYIKESTTIADVLRKLNLDPRGRNYKVVKNIIKKFLVDTSHFLGQAHAKGGNKKTIPWDLILIENSDVVLSTQRKTKLIKDGLLKNECYICGLTLWLEKKISLQLDHINGKSNDHRIENLRLLCPNCHSQTDTFAGKNNKRKITLKYNLCICGQQKNIRSEFCKQCFNNQKVDKLTVINWPSNENLIKMIQESNFLQVAKKLGVSDNAIRKRLKVRGIVV